MPIVQDFKQGVKGRRPEVGKFMSTMKWKNQTLHTTAPSLGQVDYHWGPMLAGECWTSAVPSEGRGPGRGRKGASTPADFDGTVPGHLYPTWWQYACPVHILGECRASRHVHMASHVTYIGGGIACHVGHRMSCTWASQVAYMGITSHVHGHHMLCISHNIKLPEKKSIMLTAYTFL